MGKYLSKSLVARIFARIKTFVESAVDTAKTAVGNYTVNGKKISTNPTLGKSDVGLSNVTNDAQVKRAEMGKANGVATLGADGKLTNGQLPALKTVNGESITGSGDIKIDLTLYKVVETLPTTGIDVNKIYLVLSGTAGEQNVYTEYVYVDSKWEEFGKYTAAIDLTPYVKFTDLASAVKAGAMSAADYTLLHDTATGLDTLKGRVDDLVTAGGEPNVLESVKVNGTALTVTDKAVDIPVATAAKDGVMSKGDKSKLDGIEEMTEAELDALLDEAFGNG